MTLLYITAGRILPTNWSVSSSVGKFIGNTVLYSPYRLDARLVYGATLVDSVSMPFVDDVDSRAVSIVRDRISRLRALVEWTPIDNNHLDPCSMAAIFI